MTITALNTMNHLSIVCPSSYSIDSSPFYVNSPLGFHAYSLRPVGRINCWVYCHKLYLNGIIWKPFPLILFQNAMKQDVDGLPSHFHKCLQLQGTANLNFCPGLSSQINQQLSQAATLNSYCYQNMYIYANNHCTFKIPSFLACFQMINGNSQLQRRSQFTEGRI